MGDDTDTKLVAEPDQGDKQEEAEESDLDTGLVAETDDKQQKALGSGLPEPEATEAVGGSGAAGVSVTSQDAQYDFFRCPNSGTLELFFKFHPHQSADGRRKRS